MGNRAVTFPAGQSLARFGVLLEGHLPHPPPHSGTRAPRGCSQDWAMAPQLSLGLKPHPHPNSESRTSDFTWFCISASLSAKC